MTTLLTKWTGRAVLGAVLAMSPAASAWAMPQTPPGPGRVTITEADVARSNTKMEGAYSALVAMWTTDFKQIGRRFVAPNIVNYRGAARTRCGIMRANNAAYCSAANTIYFDEIFAAGQAAQAANALHTDGDMAAVGIIAHEMGHAVAIQLGEERRTSYDNEAMADCLAGAFTQQSARDGSLERGDLDEAMAGLAAAGDPKVELTGNDRIDSRIMHQVAATGHGSGDQRMSNFRAGYDSGAGACLPEFGRSTLAPSR